MVAVDHAMNGAVDRFLNRIPNHRDRLAERPAPIEPPARAGLGQQPVQKLQKSAAILFYSLKRPRPDVVPGYLSRLQRLDGRCNGGWLWWHREAIIRIEVDIPAADT